MRFTDIRDHELPTGRLTVWVASAETLRRAESAEADPRRPSYNQHGHIAHAMARRVDPDLRDIVPEPTGEAGKAAPTGWLGVRFDVPPIGAHGLRRAFEAWVRRHETLRSGFRATSTVTGAFERFTVPPADVALEEVDLGVYTDPAAMADRLDDYFNSSTDAVCWPAYAFATIWSAKSTTVILAFDHLNVDGYSILLTVAEVRELVDADREGRPSLLPEVPSYLDFVQDELEAAEAATAEHEAVDQWRTFLRNGPTMPRFPLPDGLAPGSQVPQEAICTTIISEHEAKIFGAWCRSLGISAGTGFLAAMALAFTRLGTEAGVDDVVVDPSRPDLVGFRALVSTHTRHEACWSDVMGWFTAIAPFEVALPAGRDLPEVLPIVAEAWDDAKRGTALPLTRIGELLDVNLEHRFVMSYLDARHASGADRWAAWNSQAFIGDVGPTDQVYVWINRVPTETYLTWRYPGNDVCRSQVAAVTESMGRIIREICVAAQVAEAARVAAAQPTTSIEEVAS